MSLLAESRFNRGPQNLGVNICSTLYGNIYTYLYMYYVNSLFFQDFPPMVLKLFSTWWGFATVKCAIFGSIIYSCFCPCDSGCCWILPFPADCSHSLPIRFLNIMFYSGWGPVTTWYVEVRCHLVCSCFRGAFLSVWFFN